MSDWISVKDRLPDFGRWILAYTWRGPVIASYFNDGYYALQINQPGIKMEIKDVSHWMPLPEVPTKEKTLTRQQIGEREDQSEAREEYD